MKKTLVDFWKSLKNYFDIVMKVSFGELILHLFEFAIVILFSLAMYVPVALIKDLVFNFVRIFMSNMSNAFISGFDFIFNVISLIACLLVFMKLFTKRYIALLKVEDSENVTDKKEIKDDKKEKSKDEDLDLPKVKEKDE